jgi:hypothetical protein
MNSRNIGTALVAALVVSACGSEASSPNTDPGTGPGGGPGSGPGPGSGSITRTASDPAGDTFNNRGTAWDVTAFTVTRDSAGITVTLQFTVPIIAPTSRDSNAMIAILDFDTDQDSTTGNPATIDEFRRDSATSGMGSDFQVPLADFDADSTVPVFNESATMTGRVKPVYSGNKVSVRIPRALLGNDDGYLNAAAIVGTQASPSDIVPERGHLELSAAARLH